MQHVCVGADKIEKRLPWLDLAWIFKHWMLVNPLSILWTKVSGLRSRFVEINLLQMSYITLSDLVSKRLSAHLRKIEKIFQSWIIVLLLLIFFKTLLPIFCNIGLFWRDDAIIGSPCLTVSVSRMTWSHCVWGEWDESLVWPQPQHEDTRTSDRAPGLRAPVPCAASLAARPHLAAAASTVHWTLAATHN